MVSDSNAILKFLELNRLRHYWLYSVGTILMCLILIPSTIHIIIIKYNQDSLQNYAENALYTATQVIFQISEVLKTEPADGNTACDNEDFDDMRKVMSQYYYIGDIGRVQNGQVLCTIMYGVLKKPIPLPEKELEFLGGNYFWNDSGELDGLHPALPFAASQGSITFVAPLYINDVNIYNHIQLEHFGGKTYAYDNGYTFNIFGDADEHDIQNVQENGVGLRKYLLIPDQYVSTTSCSIRENICVLALNKKLGLFRLPYYTIAALMLTSLLVGVALSTLMDSFRSDTRILISKLHKAIRRSKITPVYQPKVSLETGKIVGVEALARWHDMTMGHIPPDTFIELAERVGIIDRLTKNFICKSLTEVCDILESDPDFKVSFNISSELLIDKSFIQFLTEEIEKYKFNKDQIMLEITERTSSNSNIMTDYSRKLASVGFLISLDDFGTGFSNLAWLSTLEPHEIKVDKMFTQSIETETINNLTLQGIFRMLDYLHVEVVFEGIETQQQYDYIKEKIPKAIGQGWHMFRPMAIDGLIKLLNKAHNPQKEKERRHSVYQ